MADAQSESEFHIGPFLDQAAIFSERPYPSKQADIARKQGAHLRLIVLEYNHRTGTTTALIRLADS